MGRTGKVGGLTPRAAAWLSAFPKAYCPVCSNTIDDILLGHSIGIRSRANSGTRPKNDFGIRLSAAHRTHLRGLYVYLVVPLLFCFQ